MRSINSSHLIGKNKGQVIVDTTGHDICVTEDHVPHFFLLQIVR